MTTTSYAILGLLAIRPWTSYEEPKKLAALGLATALKDHVGQRRRTRYTVTAEGRRELSRWLALPGRGPTLEFEALLKVFLAEHGTKQDLLATLTEVKGWAQKRAADDAQIARSYMAGSGEFPERTAQLVLVGRYLADLADMTGRWAEWATGVVEEWPEGPETATPDWDALEQVVTRVTSE